MKILKIVESGNNSTLLWALKSGADIINDQHLISLINDELFYQVMLTDVNYYELTRLKQAYRHKLRIVTESKVSFPDSTELSQLFTGTSKTGNIVLADIANNAITSLGNIVMQMYADDDIIDKNVAMMYYPMICRKFTVIIPYSFSDFVFSINAEKGGDKAIFNDHYPFSLENIHDTNPDLIRTILMNMMIVTKPISYNPHYLDLLKATKYFSLNQKNDVYTQINLLKFSKYNNITSGETSCSLFKLNSERWNDTLQSMKELPSKLIVEFASRMPIEELDRLLSYFAEDQIGVRYESPLYDGLDYGILRHNFAVKPNNENIQQINAYAQRLLQAEMALINSIKILSAQDPMQVDQSAIYALLPSIYMVNAILVVDTNKVDLSIDYGNQLIIQINNLINQLNESIQ